MSSRWCRAAVVTLSLLGITLSAACGEDMRVVAPAEPEAPAAGPSSAAAPGQDQLGAGPSTTTTVATTTTPVETTAPPTTTTTTAPEPTVPPDDPGAPDQEPEAESLAFVNQRRAENGQAPLEVDPALTAMADQWAIQIAGDQNLRHNPNLGDQAPDHYRAVGENVGYAPSASAIDQGWWESDGHRENILRPEFDAIGIAFVVDENGTTWGVQVFAGA